MFQFIPKFLYSKFPKIYYFTEIVRIKTKLIPFLKFIQSCQKFIQNFKVYEKFLMNLFQNCQGLFKISFNLFKISKFIPNLLKFISKLSKIH